MFELPEVVTLAKQITRAPSGKVLYHSPGSMVPKKFHLHIALEDESFFTVTTRMWGAIELYEQGHESDRKCLKDMRVTPIEPAFTFKYFDDLLRDVGLGENRSVKALLTQDQIIPGLGNAIAQDILFRARLHPRSPIAKLTASQKRVLYAAILDTVTQVIEKGGRATNTISTTTRADAYASWTRMRSAVPVLNVRLPSRRSSISEARATSVRPANA